MFEGPLAAAVKAKLEGDTSQANLESIATLGRADLFYSRLSTGTLRGLPTVTWTGPDEFIYVPNPDLPFSYTTSAALGSRTITPDFMPTDGGSIPRVLRGNSRFSSWGFAPAYIIHDWIFHAKKLGIKPDGLISFEDSALIMAEIIKTLMEHGFEHFTGEKKRLEKLEDTLYLMYTAVSSFVAKGLWDDNKTAVDVRFVRQRKPIT